MQNSNQKTIVNIDLQGIHIITDREFKYLKGIYSSLYQSVIKILLQTKHLKIYKAFILLIFRNVIKIQSQIKHLKTYDQETITNKALYN